MTLTEFLLARIAEDEAWAVSEPATYGMDSWSYYVGEVNGAGGIGIDPRRVLAECEAKRRLVEWATDEFWQVGNPTPMRKPSNFAGQVVLLMLATVYADHPDYLKEWRP